MIFGFMFQASKIDLSHFEHSWSKSAFLVRSPLVRLASAVPLIGYIILYGDSFQDLFNFQTSLSKPEFLIPPDIKIRLTYYGGLLIAFAVLLFYLRCPRLCRRHADIETAIDEFVRVGETEILFEALNFSDDHPSDNYLSRFATLHRDLRNLARTILHGLTDEMKNELVLKVRRHMVQKDQREFSGIRYSDLVRYYAFDLPPDHPLEHQDERFLDDLIILSMFIHTKQNDVVMWKAKNAVKSYYECLYSEHQISQWIVLAFSVVGVAFCFLPALDVLALVILSDIGFIN